MRETVEIKVHGSPTVVDFPRVGQADEKEGLGMC